jgi:hypothetical protein
MWMLYEVRGKRELELLTDFGCKEQSIDQCYSESVKKMNLVMISTRSKPHCMVTFLYNI